VPSSASGGKGCANIPTPSSSTHGEPSLLSLLATALLFYTLLTRWVADRAVSFAVVVLWLLLPSTLVVHQFLATRHYVGGGAGDLDWDAGRRS
jgi:hypothetical protein